MQAIIKTGYNAYYLLMTGKPVEIMGEDSLVDVIAIQDTGAIVDNGLVSAYVPFEYLEIKGVWNEIINEASQTSTAE